MALGSTQPLTEMSTRSIFLGQKRPVRKVDNLTNILVYCHVIWEPKLPGILWAPRALNGTDLPYANTYNFIPKQLISQSFIKEPKTGSVLMQVI